MSIADFAAGRLEFSRFSAARMKGAYLATLALGFAMLATPVALVAAVTGLLALPQPMFFPASLAILAVDLYLAARLTPLVARAALTGRVAPRAVWRLPAGMGWKLALLLAAPWTFDAAFALLGDHPQIYAQVVVFLLAAAAAFAAIAILLSVLAEAWRLVKPAQA